MPIRCTEGKNHYWLLGWYCAKCGLNKQEYDRSLREDSREQVRRIFVEVRGVSPPSAPIARHPR